MTFRNLYKEPSIRFGKTRKAFWLRFVLLSSNSAERLDAMLGNLLDVARMEAGTMEYSMQPQDITALVQTVAEEFEVQANERRIQLEVVGQDGGPWAECDRDRILQ